MKHFNLSNLTLDEHGKIVLGNKELESLVETTKAGGAKWDDQIPGFEVNWLSCRGEKNVAGCTNYIDCDSTKNPESCANTFCDGSLNPAQCVNSRTCKPS